MSTKQITFLNEIIFKYLPEFLSNTSLQQHYIEIINKYPTSIDVENLIEHALAFLGGYNFVDEEYRDFNDKDNSDSKTVTVNYKTGRAEVGSIENKIGAIRLTIYNPLSINKLQYMFLPKYAVGLLARPCYGKSSHKTRLIPIWSPRTQSYNMFQPYLVDSFKDLATFTEHEFYTKRPHLAPRSWKITQTAFINGVVPTPLIQPLSTNAILQDQCLTV